MSFKTWVTALAIAMLSATQVLAGEDCGTEVHLDDVGGSMENVPPLNQKSMPICYAFSAAELLQTWRCSHGTGDCQSQMVSPVSIAVNAELFEINHHTAKVTGDGAEQEAFWGYSRKQIGASDLFRGPYCDQVALGSLDQNSEWNRDINELFAIYRENCIHPVSMFQDAGSDPVAQVSCRLLDVPFSPGSFDTLAHNMEKCLADDGLPVDMKQIETALVSSNPFLLIQGKIQETCQHNPVSVPPMPPIDFYSIKPKDGNEPDKDRTLKAKQAIAAEFDHLGKNGQPIFVTYCADVVPGGRSFVAAYGKDDCSGHASLIIGRRKDPKTKACQYLIRNSWGKTCNRDASKSHFAYHENWDCDQDKGDFWIDQDSLMNATLEVGGVEKEGIGGLIPKDYLSSQTPASN